MPAILLFMSRYWKWLAGGFAVVAIVIGFQLLQSKLSTANSKLDTAVAQRNELDAKLQVSNASITGMQAEVDKQNDAIAQFAIDSDKRAQAGRSAILAEVKRGAKASAVAASLASKPKSDGDQAATSETVMANRGML